MPSEARGWIHVELWPQEHPMECGIACMAMVMGVSLDDSRAAFDRVYPGARAKGRGVTEGITNTEIDIVLAECGYAVSRLYCGTKDNRRDPWPPEPFADLHIAQVAMSNGGHFVVLLRDGTVLDPQHGVTRIDDPRYGAVQNVAAVVPLRAAHQERDAETSRYMAAAGDEIARLNAEVAQLRVQAGDLRCKQCGVEIDPLCADCRAEFRCEACGDVIEDNEFVSTLDGVYLHMRCAGDDDA